MIVGPAGSGKTTLAAWYARMLKNRPGWEVVWLDASSVRSADELSSALPEDIGVLKTQFLLVVDEVHLLTAKAAIGYLSGMVQASPDNFHIMLVGQRNPGIRLHHLRMKDQVVEISRDDLTFGEADVGKFFEERRISLSSDQVRSIAAATNGWPAGLQMIALFAKESSEPDRVLSDPASGYPLDRGLPPRGSPP